MDRMQEVDAKEQAILETLGAEGAFDALSKALSYDAKEEMYDYIMRCYEIEAPDLGEER